MDMRHDREKPLPPQPPCVPSRRDRHPEAVLGQQDFSNVAGSRRDGHAPGTTGVRRDEPQPALPEPKSQATASAFLLDEGEASSSGLTLEPRKFKDKTAIHTLYNVGDVIMALAPITFIVFAVLAALLDGKVKRSNTLGSCIEQALDITPTLFPIAFAAIAGRSMKIIARYCAEKGTRLGTLELLMASQTVWGAFESQVLLRTLSLLSFHLLLLWTLSPLGSQAALRILGSASPTSNATANALYLPTGGMSMQQVARGAFYTGSATSLRAGTNALYNAALLAPDKAQQQDAWGNVKLPWLDDMNHAVQDIGDWMPVQNAGLFSSDNYTALVGLPLASPLHASTKTTLELDYGYLSVSCRQPALVMPKSDARWKQSLGQLWSSSAQSTSLESQDAMFYSASLGQTSFFLDTAEPFGDRIAALYKNISGASQGSNVVPHHPRSIVFGSETFATNAEGFDITVYTCQLAQKYVTSQITCIGLSCRATHLRPSKRFANRDPSITPLDLKQIAYYLMTSLPHAGGQLHVGDSSPSELFLRGSQAPFDDLDQWSGSGSGSTLSSSSSSSSDTAAVAAATLPSLSELSPTLFARRLSILLNTYYTLSLSPSSFTGTASLPPPPSSLGKSWGPFGNGSSLYSTTANDPPYAPGTGIASGAPAGPFFGIPTTARVSKPLPEVYTVNWFWLCLLVAASSILLILGIASVIIGAKVKAPDFLGYVASSTYNSCTMGSCSCTHGICSLGNGKSGAHRWDYWEEQWQLQRTAEDAMDRARRLKGMKVVLGDVWHGRDVGRVGLSWDLEARGKLESGRLYV